MVARASFALTTWFNLTYRTPLDHKTFATRMADALATFGVQKFAVSTGHILHGQPPPAGSPYYTPRSEVTVAVSSNWGKLSDYRLGARRNIQLSQMVAVGGDPYEDECYILDFQFYKRYTLFNGDYDATTVLVQMTLKAVGQFGSKTLRLSRSAWLCLKNELPGVFWPC